jgi:glycosyltransferase involved in cell wall biosynthesis
VDTVLKAAKASGIPVGLDPKENHELGLGGITVLDHGEGWIGEHAEGDRRHPQEATERLIPFDILPPGARSLGIGGRVTFRGRVEQHELPLFYNAADLLALPS